MHIPDHIPSGYQRWKYALEYCYKMGVDRALNGANTTNCHWSLFSSPERTKEWERGEADGKKERRSCTGDT